MKKTLNINIAGQLFMIDEEAWDILTRYLNHVSASFGSEQGSEETMADIESRIAEIFGGGKEPPTLISAEMVNDMINIMGAPEDYYDDKTVSHSGTVYERKSMYDPNSLSARTGRALSDFFKAFGKIMSAVIRVFAVITGVIFTITGFVLLFTFVLVIFFTNTPIVSSLMEPEITNAHTLLSIVLNTHLVWPVLILASLVILLPLLGMTYLGIRMIFNIRERFRVMNIILFVTWIASVCALGVVLGFQLPVYATTEETEKRLTLDTPPRTLWIAPLHKVTDISYDEHASVDDFTFYHDASADRLFVTPDLNIYGNDNGSGWISVERRASSTSEKEALANARQIEFNWKLSGDTLYLDEFFSLPGGRKWNGSVVDVNVSLPEGTEIRLAPGVSPVTWMLRADDNGSTAWRITDGRLESIEVQ